MLADGTNPAEARRADKRARLLSAENTFAAIAGEWIAKQSAKWTPHHAADVLRSLEQGAFPAFGSRPEAATGDGPLLGSMLTRALQS
ncbi:MAG: phage integrase central domain-containing protein [Gammaproteobacteria bacterium]